jgi:hypothetical protein
VCRLTVAAAAEPSRTASAAAVAAGTIEERVDVKATSGYTDPAPSS